MRAIMVLCLLVLSIPVLAQTPTAASKPAADTPPDEIVDLDSVVVSGTPSGPGLWKVSRGDHVLWILGTLSPLPKRMAWDTREVEAVIAQAQEVIEAPRIEITPKIGVFRKVLLLPAIMGARKNPNGAMLRDVVPEAEYARWQTLKSRHLGGDRSVEAYRPIFAAGELYREAIADVGLTYDNPVRSTVERLARQHGVKVTAPKVAIQVRKPKAVLEKFTTQSLDDAGCFSRTLDRVESELGTMRDHADAWAVGDLPAMRALPPVSAQYEACAGALTEAALARELGVGDLRARTEAVWLAAAERALSANQVTIALLPITDLLKARSVTTTLRARGYLVEAPASGIGIAGETPATPVLEASLSPLR